MNAMNKMYQILCCDESGEYCLGEYLENAANWFFNALQNEGRKVRLVPINAEG